MVVTRMLCHFPDCILGQGTEQGGRYRTPDNLNTIDQTNANMAQHMQAHAVIEAREARDEARAQREHEQQQAREQAGGPTAKSRAPKIDRPKLEMDIHDLEWDHFLAEWGCFKRSCGLTD